MIDESSQVITVKDFGGAQTLTDPAEVPSGYALVARNVQYLGKQVGTRYGFGQAFNPNEAITSMFNWISSLGNYLVWFRSSDRSIRIANISSSPTSGQLVPADLVGYASSHASAGARIYHAVFNTNARGAVGGYVSCFQSSAFVSDPVFQGPLTYAPSAPTESLAGFITAGLHRIGYRIEYRSGFITRPSPDSGVGTPSPTTFVPISFTASGSKNCSITLNTAWPAGAVAVSIVMTPVTNLNQYIQVPGANIAVVGGTTQSVTIAFSISDDDLLGSSNVTQVTDSLNLLTNTVSGTPPFFPSVVFTHGDRMVYIATVPDNVGNASGAAFVSNLGAYQEISADQHLIQLPSRLDIITGCSIAGGLYLFGPQWTYRTSDNGSFPVTWPTPALVDGRRGTLAPRGVEVSPSGVYAWVPDTTGLYLFEGSYPDLPISYLQGGAEWARINWGVAYTLIVKDFTDAKKVVVMAALDSETTASHMLVWDYSSGRDWSKVRFSFDDTGSLSLGAMEIVQNTLAGTPAAANKTKELWLGPSVANSIFRSLSNADANPYRDGGLSVDSQYQTAFLRPDAKLHITQHQGAHLRLTGVGPLAITDETFDDTTQVGPDYALLSTAPGGDYFHPINLLNEGVSYNLEAGGNLCADPSFELSNASTSYWDVSANSKWSVTTGSPHTGTHHAKHSTGTAPAADGLLNVGGVIPAQPGAFYFFQFWAKKALSPDGTLQGGVSFLNASGGIISSQAITPTLTTSYAAYFGTTSAAPAGTAFVRADFFALNKTTGEFYVDDVTFSQLDSYFILSYLRHYWSDWAMQF